ncbi:MAG TPA: LytTR family DNA-binding domain-containing protein [Puia sp.]|jgi:DNA-binding LytR/AlgR family response regulator|nr:LytTR family DNA-binding domain-containing protein [Puia sp.]
MKPSCIIIDDEQPARNGLKEDLLALGIFTVAGVAADAEQARELLKTTTTDLLFLDVEMPWKNGLEFLSGLDVKPMVILVTAYPQYALNGYEHGVVDYLLKPVSPERLKLACEKALEWWVLRNNTGGQTGPAGYLYIKTNGRFEKIGYDEILYLEAANNYVIVHTRQKKYLVYQTLKGMEKQLPNRAFLQTHKSFIVARPHIRQIDRDSISVGEVRIPLSRRFKQRFLTELRLTNNIQPVK